MGLAFDLMFSRLCPGETLRHHLRSPDRKLAGPGPAPFVAQLCWFWFSSLELLLPKHLCSQQCCGKMLRLKGMGQEAHASEKPSSSMYGVGGPIDRGL